MKNSSEKVIYQKDVIEFVQVSVQYCALLEQGAQSKRSELVDTLLKLMPLMYMKALLLPKVESDGSFLPDEQVTEADYNFVRYGLADLFGNDDEYLEVVSDDLMQTDETGWKRISEQLADIYQPVRNFLATYKEGVEDCMHDALWSVVDSFELYWGECLVDALRRLHRIKFAIKDSIDEDTEG